MAMAAPALTNGVAMFDSFPGATVDAKITAMNAWHASLAAGAPHPTVMFGTQTYAHTVPIQLWSGMSLAGARRGPAREYSTGTVLHYTGPAGSSQLAFVHNNQGYPGDGSPRDIVFDSLQFTGGPVVHWMPKNDPGTSPSYAGKTLWMSTIHNCGWIGFATIWWGWSDGTSISGVTHAQGYSDTPFYLSGSETSLFGHDGFSFMDSKAAGWAASGKPTIRSRLKESSIGRVMVTARQTAYHLSIEGGGELDVDGFYADAQDTDPVYGAAIRITGGEGIILRAVNFKGAMANPAKAAGGVAGNGGWIHIAGGSQISVDACRFSLEAGMATAATPLAYADAGMPAGQIHWGLSNVTYGFHGPAKIGQAKPGLITINTYPQIAVVT